ncbi:MAG: sulfatase-like hydrolase/transferase [Planctomycetota bacterium]|jgi:arylsulfatase A-like enzyme
MRAKKKRRNLSRRRLMKSAAAAGAGLGLGLIGFPYVLRGRSREKDVIVFISDAMRGDCIAKVLNGREVTPNLNRFAEADLNFSQAYSAAHSTKPSVASILSGMYTPGHGVEMPFFTLPNCHNLVSFHAQKGYRTLALSANNYIDEERHFFNSPTGRLYNQGKLHARHRFGFWKEIDHLLVFPDPNKKDRALGPQAMGMRRFDCYVTGEEVVREFSSAVDAIGRRETLDRKPLFAYLHIMDTHQPYIRGHPVAGVTGLFHAGSGASVEEIHAADAELIDRLFITGEHADRMAAVLKMTDADVERLRAIYHEAAHYADGCFGRFLDELKERRMYERSVIVFSADHGDELKDEGGTSSTLTFGVGHNRPVIRTLHVPLIIKHPDLAAAEVAQRVTNAGILPTLMEMNGEQLEGSNVPSLLPWVAGRPRSNAEIYAAYKGQEKAILPDGRGAVRFDSPEVSFRHLREDGAEVGAQLDSEVLERMEKIRYFSRILAEQAGVRRRFSTHDWQNPWARRQRDFARNLAATKGIPYPAALERVSFGLGIPRDELQQALAGGHREVDVQSLPDAQREQLKALGYLN